MNTVAAVASAASHTRQTAPKMTSNAKEFLPRLKREQKREKRRRRRRRWHFVESSNHQSNMQRRHKTPPPPPPRTSLLLFSSPLFFSTFFSLSGDATYSSYTFRPPRAFSATASSSSSSSRGRRLLNKCGIYTEEKCAVIQTTRRKFDKQIEKKRECAVAFLFLGESLYETHFEYGRRVQLLLDAAAAFCLFSRSTFSPWRLRLFRHHNVRFVPGLFCLAQYVLRTWRLYQMLPHIPVPHLQKRFFEKQSS